MLNLYLTPAPGIIVTPDVVAERGQGHIRGEMVCLVLERDFLTRCDAHLVQVFSFHWLHLSLTSEINYMLKSSYC